MSYRDRWELMPWIWVILCSFFIFLTIPFARGIQRFVYNAFGKELFTYTILIIVLIAFIALLYLFIFRLRIRRFSQYIWLAASAALYSYFTIKLKEHPEEAFHFLEYGVLSYLFFIALSKRVHDHSIYITSISFVLLIGVLDEFIQWMMPERFWDIRDVGLNTLSAAISMLGLWRGIRPIYINKPVRRLSVNMLLSIVTIDLLFLGFCLSNTPEVVSYYAKGVVSWLKDEEPMVEYGYRYRDPDIGVIYSRLTLKQINEIDTHYGASYGIEIANALNKGSSFKDLMGAYKPPENIFIYEFIIHLQRREDALEVFKESNYSYTRHINTALKENLILERYFKNTLRHAGYTMSDDTLKELKKQALINDEMYASSVGMLITAFNQKTAWTIILITIIGLWAGATFYKRCLSA